MFWKHKTLFILLTAGCLTCACLLPLTTNTPTPTTVPPVFPTQTTQAASSQPTIAAPPTPTITSDQSVLPPSPNLTHQGNLNFPYLSADAGNFSLQANETITINWEDAPPNAERYEFSLRQDTQSTLIGIDHDPTNGIQIEWFVPENLSAVLEATAYFPDNSIVLSAAPPMVHSSSAPPIDTCTLSNTTIGPINIYLGPDTNSKIFAHLLPGPYYEAVEYRQDNWFLIKVSEAYLLDNNADNPDTGWVSSQHGIKTNGPCDRLPTQ